MNIYKELLLLISQNIQNKKDKEFIINNIDNLVNKYSYLSKIIYEISIIVMNPLFNYNKKINKIHTLLHISNKQSKHLLNKIKIPNETQFGGVHNEDLKKISETNPNLDNICLFNLPILSLELLATFPEKILKILMNLPQFINSIDFQDFKKPLDYIYIFLFITASTPIIGSISDFIIISKALLDNNIYLALIVFVTRFISFFSWNMFDMGSIIKLIYALDNYSYINYSKIIN